MKEELTKKSKSLKLAISRYNMFNEFVEQYTCTKSLKSYIEYIRSIQSTLSEDMSDYYDNIINIYYKGDQQQLLSNLYDKLLAADEHKKKIANEIKLLLGLS